ncbi:protein SPA1-RELATED 4-like isoform X1 [Rosa rugosa]|uniref:protein SPA1-RELATED 4-like isoform X1 n=1 Tax=Rosa rugosa TaxID=74645 RepID=UPI002B411FEE|nr:protein SPA1-RELATED 4-like isoform X1 [Rosa rugosa]XP_062011373.1 protein SPA1-RELATED 4-like isoform X1 [Rosa rugosa]XP_062011374.1 protein SPA1-RELATED 4-like isoform X1 [Rosa rugosa]XP_062011375.1 protein SPA1-RELATED 4-like isoform X1 [Rosa rugosa]
MCVLLPSCCYRRIIMEGSSESAWQRSNSSRDLNTSRVSNRNPRLSHSRRFGFLGGSLQDSDLRNERDGVVVAHTDDLGNQGGLSGVCEDEVPVEPFVRAIEWGDVSLRQWLDRPDRSVDAFECLHVFRQIVEIVNVAHSEGIVVHNVRPSCFVMSSFNHVSFIESASCSDSGTDSPEDGLNSPTLESKNLTSALHQKRSNIARGNFQFMKAPANTLSDTGCMQSSSIYAARESLMQESEEHRTRERSAQLEDKRQPFPMKQILLMESNWYTSPEEVAGGPSPCASDIYRLGVLLFELFCPFSSREEKSRTMSSLRHRVLPPQLLLRWPKEASFCLWLLHPEPNSRPKMGELLQSEFLNEPRDDLEEREAAIELREKIEEQELLLEFLLLVKQRKQEAADKLRNTVSFLCSDIEEVVKHKTSSKGKGGSCPELVKEDHSTSSFPSMNITDDDDSASGSRKRFRPGVHIHNGEECDDNLDGQKSETGNQESILLRSSRLMNNFKKLESAYFLTRCRPIKHSAKPLTRHSSISSDGRGSIVATERSSVSNLTLKEQHSEGRRSGWIEPFLEGLCKYLSFSKLKVKADLKQADLLNSSNLVCSLSFDRDGEFFATAGVNKKIKIFECDSIINEDRDIHYPVVEIATRSKLSNICWNSYIKSQIASSNFEGVVQVWDVTRSQVLMEMKEHEKRVWSIDFSSADPTMLASGSDDGSVKLWSINQGESIGTIKTKANVCCVQFPLDSCRSLAFGSADHKIYYYDLRNLKVPLCTLIGHNKTVSYVKFIDRMNLVSASTDNTLKLWDLSTCTSRVIDTPVMSFTGHMNVKNFVGLSVSDGYIATGSETNEVFVYHKVFPMPALSYKFQATDPLSGQDTDDAAQFISSVCWRGQSSTLIAANSTGNIKILEMV